MPLKQEGGVTKISLENGELLRNLHGFPVKVTLHWDPEGAEYYRTVAFYKDGHQHTFTGFGWGYGGEGPRGLCEWLETNGFDKIMDPEKGLPLESPRRVIPRIRNTGPAGTVLTLWRVP